MDGFVALLPTSVPDLAGYFLGIDPAHCDCMHGTGGEPQRRGSPPNDLPRLNRRLEAYRRIGEGTGRKHYSSASAIFSARFSSTILAGERVPTKFVRDQKSTRLNS